MSPSLKQNTERLKDLKQINSDNFFFIYLTYFWYNFFIKIRDHFTYLNDNNFTQKKCNTQKNPISNVSLLFVLKKILKCRHVLELNYILQNKQYKLVLQKSSFKMPRLIFILSYFPSGMKTSHSFDNLENPQLHDTFCQIWFK